MIARASLEIAACRASVMFSGHVSRIQRLPSSNSGMNSRPSDGSRQAVPAISDRKEQHGQPTVLQAAVQLPQIAVLDEANEEIVGNRLEILEQQQAQHGRQHHRQGQGPGQRRGIGLRHRAEQGPCRPLHREQGNERAHHDERRKQQGAVDFARRAKDAGLQRQIGVLPAGQVTVDVLGNDDRGIDDDAEVHRADGEQVRRLAPQEEHRKGEQQRQRNVDGHDQRGPHVAQEHATGSSTTRPMPISRFSVTVSVVMLVNSLRS